MSDKSRMGSIETRLTMEKSGKRLYQRRDDFQGSPSACVWCPMTVKVIHPSDSVVSSNKQYPFRQQYVLVRKLILRLRTIGLDWDCACKFALGATISSPY